MKELVNNGAGEGRVDSLTTDKAAIEDWPGQHADAEVDVQRTRQVPSLDRLGKDRPSGRHTVPRKSCTSKRTSGSRSLASTSAETAGAHSESVSPRTSPLSIAVSLSRTAPGGGAWRWPGKRFANASQISPERDRRCRRTGNATASERSVLLHAEATVDDRRTSSADEAPAGALPARKLMPVTNVTFTRPPARQANTVAPTEDARLNRSRAAILRAAADLLIEAAPGA